MGWFTILLCVALILWGINTFVPERVIAVIAAICAIIAGAIGLLNGRI